MPLLTTLQPGLPILRKMYLKFSYDWPKDIRLLVHRNGNIDETDSIPFAFGQGSMTRVIESVRVWGGGGGIGWVKISITRYIRPLLAYLTHIA